MKKMWDVDPARRIIIINNVVVMFIYVSTGVHLKNVHIGGTDTVLFALSWRRQYSVCARADFVQPSNLQRAPPPWATQSPVLPLARAVHSSIAHCLPPPCFLHTPPPIAARSQPSSVHLFPPPWLAQKSDPPLAALEQLCTWHRAPPPWFLQKEVVPWASLSHHCTWQHLANRLPSHRFRSPLTKYNSPLIRLFVSGAIGICLLVFVIDPVLKAEAACRIEISANLRLWDAACKWGRTPGDITGEIVGCGTKHDVSICGK